MARATKKQSNNNNQSIFYTVGNAVLSKSGKAVLLFGDDGQQWGFIVVKQLKSVLNKEIPTCQIRAVKSK